MAFSNSGNNPCVILVDEFDNELGTQEKLRAHQCGGQLHRAFSIFIADGRGRILLQRRARNKYHCPGLWTNSCCSHPQPGKSLLKSAQRRLQVELGFSASLQKIGAVQYQLALDDGLTEWEFDHIFLGLYKGRIRPNPLEVEECRWVRTSELGQDIQNHAEHYTPWLPKIFPVLLEHLRVQVDAFPGGIAINS